ncbi:MAG TPA: class I SAM-dependent methyltransferase, partial [Clostridia bacterium]|nr:class I SAM-dependent methyltransferase [Clostridia bacterium]
GMRSNTCEKNQFLTIVDGNHENIPFEDDLFDFVYMTDVIHHVPDINMMFEEIARVLKPGGKLCVVTESHKQIDNRFYVKYFPSTATVDKSRYPDIADIIEAAWSKGLTNTKTIVINEDAEFNIDQTFIDLVANKGFSMFHLIPQRELKDGCRNSSMTCRKGLQCKNSGETLV